MATVTEYEDACAEIVFAFAEALRLRRALDATEECDDGDCMMPAFAVAAKYGWDWNTDDDFTSWCLKATHQEICIEGLRRALAGVSLGRSK